MVLTNNLLTAVKSDVRNYIESVFAFANIGEDDTIARATDTELGSEILRVAVSASDKSVTDTITLSAIIPPTQANDSFIKETGWVSEDYLMVDDCDAITDWTDSADMTVHLNNTTFYQGTGAIDLTKDGAANALATTHKTTTSVDFTGKNLGLILYIIDATALAKLATTDAVIIRFGSDNSNYYEWKYDLADLTTGKQLLNSMNSTNATTTGTPDITACDYTYIGLTADAAATTWSDGDIIMDFIQVYGGTQYVRNTVTTIGKTDDIELYLDTTIKIKTTQS